VALDKDGMLPDALEAACSGEAGRALLHAVVSEPDGRLDAGSSSS
jgi:hypothetical protein